MQAVVTGALVLVPVLILFAQCAFCYVVYTIAKDFYSTRSSCTDQNWKRTTLQLESFTTIKLLLLQILHLIIDCKLKSRFEYIRSCSSNKEYSYFVAWFRLPYVFQTYIWCDICMFGICEIRKIYFFSECLWAFLLCCIRQYLKIISYCRQ